MKRKALRTAGAAMAAVMLSQVCTFGASAYFKDVTSKYDWATQAIDSLYADGVVSGFDDGYFRPASNIRRCDFLVMLYSRFAESGSYTSALPDDVEKEAYYGNAYMWAAASGIVTPGELFYPTADITRQDAFEMLFKSLELDGTVQEEDISSDLSAFSDGDYVDQDKVTAVGSLVAMGIVSGSDGQILPENTMTRAEMAVVFYKAGQINEEEAVGSEGIIVDASTSMDVTTADSKYNITTSVDTNYLVDGIKAALTDEKIEVKESDKSGIIIQNGAELSLSKSRLVKSGDSTSSVNTGASGVNSAIVLRSGSTLDLKTAVINNVGTFSNGINVQDGGNILTIDDCGVVTNGENSTPLLVADNSTVKASNSTFSVKAANTPAINILGEDAIVSLEDCTLNSYGNNAPALKNMSENLVLNGGELISKSDSALETIGNTNVIINGTTLTGTAALMRITSTAKTASDGTIKNTTTIKNADLTSKTGEALIEVVNTGADVYITGSTLKSSNILFFTKIDTTGNASARGAETVFTLDAQDAEGVVLSNWGGISTVILENGSAIKGALGPNQEGTVNVELKSNNDKLILTSDCYIGYIKNHDDYGFNNISDNGYNIYYDTNLDENIWLGKDTYILPSGGRLTPAF